MLVERRRQGVFVDDGAVARHHVPGCEGGDQPRERIGDPDLNLWAILVAASWRHTGYMMILYLVGLKGVDPSLREASALDGALF